MEKRKDFNYFDGLDEVYVEPMKDGTPIYNIKKAYEYCEKNNLDIEKISEKELEEYVGKKIKIIFNSGGEYSGLCTEYIEPMEEDEEPMIFCDPNLAVNQSEIKEITEVIEDTQ